MTHDPSRQLRAVGGWLLFLCIILTIFTPIGLLSCFREAAALSNETKDGFPTFSNAVMWAALPNLVLSILSFRAGVLLWKRKSGAVSNAQTFLVVYMAYFMALVCIAYTGDLPPVAQEAVRNDYGVSALRAVVFGTFWHQYLRRSTRVRNTFRL